MAHEATLSRAALEWFESSEIDPHDPLWLGFDPTAHPGYAAFEAVEAWWEPIRTATTIEAWLAAMRAKPNPTSGESALIASVAADPDRYELVGGGAVRERPGWVARNLWWLGPTAIVGGSLVPLALGGGGASGAAAAAPVGVLPSSSLPILPLATAAPSVGASAAITAATGAGVAGVSAIATGTGASVIPSSSGPLSALLNAAPSVVGGAAVDPNTWIDTVGDAAREWLDWLRVRQPSPDATSATADTAARDAALRQQNNQTLLVLGIGIIVLIAVTR